jgi:pimeloyl-ACP methyl ester carboxylesterase
MAERPSAALGTVLRAGAVAELAAAVGFSSAVPGTRSGRRRWWEVTVMPVQAFGWAHHDSSVVTAEDGVRLHAQLEGPPDAPVTAVLCHGYALTSDSWHFQRAQLSGYARVVSWDYRGHGRSGRGRPPTTIDQLGRDLFTVLEHTAPDRPVVLIGHSLGGMVILALAEQHPELFGDRVRGVALLASAAGPVHASLGLPPRAAAALNRTALGVASTLDRFQFLPDVSGVAKALTLLLAQRCSFASKAPARLVTFLADTIHTTPLEVVLDLLPQFVVLDKLAALPVLRGVRTLVLAAADDLVTSPEHSRAMAEAVPGAELVIVPNAGHAVLLEHPESVNRHLRALLTRASDQPRGPAHPSHKPLRFAAS